MSALFEVTGIFKFFGGLRALDGVSLNVEAGELVGLIGPNGSGKTTLFNCATGLLPPDGGTIRFRGQELVGQPPHAIAQAGIGRTFQLTRVFPDLTVWENLLLGQPHRGEPIAEALVRASPGGVRQRARELLAFIGIEHLANEPAGELSYGQQRLLEFAMVLMPEPALVLLDEPTAGVNPALIDRIMEHILAMNEQGTTFLIIEHNMEVIMTLSERIYFLSEGKKIAEGPPAAIQANPQVLEAYYGA
ncbi:MAG: ABC transporter ATP-binding protein [Nitrospinota bacterium]